VSYRRILCDESQVRRSGRPKAVSHFPEVPAWQVSPVGSKDFETADGVRVAPARVLLSQLVPFEERNRHPAASAATRPSALAQR
jgi:hypothetical protein